MIELNTELSPIQMMEKAGFILFPIRVDKIPAVEGWNKAIYKQYHSSSIVGSYGVVLQEDIVVIDVDPRNFPAGSDSWNSFFTDFNLADLIDKSDPFIVQTGEGVHIYLRKPESVHIRGFIKDEESKNDKYPGVEFKSKGRFVLGPGSYHENEGVNYTIVSGSPFSISDCPSDLLEAIERPKMEIIKAKPNTEANVMAAQHRFKKLLSAAKAPEHGNRSNQYYQLSCKAKEYGVLEEDAFEILSDFEETHQTGFSVEELMTVVRNAYVYSKNEIASYSPESFFEIESEIDQNGVLAPVEKPDFFKYLTQKLEKTTAGKVIGSLQNIIKAFYYNVELKSLFRKNLFHGLVEYSRKPIWPTQSELFDWDIDVIHIKAYLGLMWPGFDCSLSVIREAVHLYSCYYTYHPIKEYLENLVWDGEYRLDRALIDYCGASDTLYNRACSKNVFIAAVNRIYHPGCKFDHMLILEGPQGLAKSEFFSIMGKEWYGSVQLNPNKKEDTLEAMRRNWIVEEPELGASSKADIQSLKALITDKVDIYRKVYEHDTKTRPRNFILTGTVNPDVDKGYLRDTTGNRRFWPVTIKKIDTERLKEDIDQLWAEAYERYLKKEEYYMNTDELVIAAKKEQEARMVTDPWEEIIYHYIQKSPENFYAAKDLIAMSLGLPLHQQTNYHYKRVATIMDKLGYDNVRKRIGDSLYRGYEKRPETTETP